MDGGDFPSQQTEQLLYSAFIPTPMEQRLGLSIFKTPKQKRATSPPTTSQQPLLQ
jgi:hypothetical protein